MTVINTNTSSLVARDAIQRNDRAMSSAMERLSTGSRINSAKDDAAGLAIAGAHELDRWGPQYGCTKCQRWYFIASDS